MKLTGVSRGYVTNSTEPEGPGLVRENQGKSAVRRPSGMRTKQGKGKELAKKFYEFVQSKDGARIFAKWGWIHPKRSETIVKFMLSSVLVAMVGVYLLKDLGVAKLSIKPTVSLRPFIDFTIV